MRDEGRGKGTDEEIGRDVLGEDEKICIRIEKDDKGRKEK